MKNRGENAHTHDRYEVFAKVMRPTSAVGKKRAENSERKLSTGEKQDGVFVGVCVMVYPCRGND